MLRLITKHIHALFVVGLMLTTSLHTQAAEWSEQELRILASFQLSRLPHHPNDQSNQFAYNSHAAKLGKQIFFDKRFSLNGSIACASCHQPDKAFTDGLKKAKGIHKTGRNTPTVLGAAYYDWFYWDGRKDSLWSQALVPFEAADEMASSRVQVLRIVGKDKNYRKQYEALFGKFPDSIYQPSIKAQAGPWGDQKTRNNWYRIPVNTQKQINHAYANIGKAVAAYERTIALPETKFDRYLKTLFTKGEKKASPILSKDALAGLALFINQPKTQCLQCHNGPLFTNGDFHNIGTGSFEGPELDFGRYLGIQAVMQDEFNCLGPYSDAKPESCFALRFLSKQIHGETQGAYKTPSLRYLNKTAPYFHDGRFEHLQDVLKHYLSVNKTDTDLRALSLSKEEVQQLIAFIRTLDE